MITPEDLLLVQAIVEEGSVSAAADRLTTSQPALSRTLGDLERRLGVKLFERLPRGMAPTPAGKAIAEHGRAVTAVTQHALRDLEATRNAGAAELRIGIVPQIGIVPVVRALATLQQLERPVRLEAQVGPEDVLLAALREGALDMLIGSGWPDDEALVATPLFNERSSLVARRGHPVFAKRKGIDVADLAGYPWVMPPASDPITSRLRALFFDRGIDPPAPAVVTTDVPLRTSLVITSDFVTVLPRDVVVIAMNTLPLEVIPIELPGPQGVVSALRRRDVPVRPEVDYLLASILTELRRFGIELAN